MSSFSPSSFLSLFDGSVIPFDQANSQSTNQPNLFDLSCFYDEAAVQIPDNAINTTPLQPTKQSSIRPTMHSESNKSINQSKRSSGESTPFLDLQAVTSWMANLFTDDEPVDQSSDENSETNDSPRSLINQPQIQAVLPSTTQSTHPTSASRKSVKHQSADATPINIQSANQPTNSTSRAIDLPKSSDPTTRGRPVNRAVNQSANHARLHRSPVLWKRSIESTSKSSQTSHSSTHQSINLSDKHPKVTSLTSSSSTPAPAAPSRSRPDVRRASKPVLNVKCLSDSSASISLSPDSEHASNPIPCASQSVADDQSINQPGEAVTESSSSGDNISATSTSNETVDASMSVGTQMPSPAAHNVDNINQPTPIVKMTLIGSALNEANLDYFAAESGSMIIVHHEEHQPTNQQQLSDDDSQEWDSFDDDVDEIVDIDTLRDRKRADNQPINQCDDDWTPVRVDEMSSSGSSEEFEILDQKVLQQQ